jgi:hypothetical protein
MLVPFGRMALTNCLCQSLVMSMFFFGYGLGNWGLGRASQLVFALALCGVQIAFSHWWLARFRYGPAEWLLRAITYMKIPAMRIEAAPGGLQAQPTREGMKTCSRETVIPATGRNDFPRRRESIPRWISDVVSDRDACSAWGELMQCMGSRLRGNDAE